MASALAAFAAAFASAFRAFASGFESGFASGFEGGLTGCLVAAPASSVVFDRGSDVDGVRYAAPSQVAVDLLTGPGRNPAEGQALLDWMESDESAWRK